MKEKDRARHWRGLFRLFAGLVLVAPGSAAEAQVFDGARIWTGFTQSPTSGTDTRDVGADVAFSLGSRFGVQAGYLVSQHV